MTITQENLTFFLAILSISGVVFSIHNSYRKPQEEIEKKQAVDEEVASAKAKVLAQQFADEKEVNQRRFLEMGTRLDNTMTTAQNHIHSVDTKVDSLRADVSKLNENVVTLTTVVNERIPAMEWGLRKKK